MPTGRRSSGQIAKRRLERPEQRKHSCTRCGARYRSRYTGSHPICGLCQNAGSIISSSSDSEEPEQQVLRFYHGTSYANAQQIERCGFDESSGGCLGRGVYVAQEGKARGFALTRARRNNSTGGLVHVLIRFRYPKYVSSNDIGWRDEGYDACRTDSTNFSTNMEWCVSSDQVEVLRIEEIDPYDIDEDELDECEAAIDEEELRWHD